MLADGDELANHLSRNSAMHNYNETAEEVLVTCLKQVYEKYKKENADSCIEVASKHLEAARTSTEKTNGRLTKVMNNVDLCILLSGNLLQLGRHFRRRREFSVTWLSTSMRVCMGVSFFLLLLN